MTSIILRVLDNTGSDCRECLTLKLKIFNHLIKEHKKILDKEIRSSLEV